MIKVKRFSPKANIVVILADEVEEVTQTEGGVLLPDDVKPTTLPRIGEIYAIGPDAVRAKDEHRVYFSAYAGTKVEIDGIVYLWMTDDHIIAGV